MYIYICQLLSMYKVRSYVYIYTAFIIYSFLSGEECLEASLPWIFSKFPLRSPKMGHLSWVEHSFVCPKAKHSVFGVSLGNDLKRKGG